MSPGGRKLGRARARLLGVLGVAVAALASVGTARAQATRGAAEAVPASSSAVRTTLVWIYGDDDALHAPDAQNPPSPAASIGDRPGYEALGSGLRSRYTGRENRVELGVTGTAPGFVPTLTTSAALALGLDASTLGERDEPTRLEDLGSFVEARFALEPAAVTRCTGLAPGPSSPGPSVGLRLYPIDGDRERVGWLEALGWGGATGPRRESPYATARGAVRAARLALSLSRVEAFATLKTASFLEPIENAPAVEETSYGGFAGVEAQPFELLTLGVAGGYFEHGKLEGPARGSRAFTGGLSARLVVASGMREPRSPVAFLGQGDDVFHPDPDAVSGSWAVGVEGVGLVQRLADFDHPGRTALSAARGVALVAGGRLGPVEGSAAFVARDPELVMRNVPGVFPGQTLPAAAQRVSERTLLLTSWLIASRVFRIELALGVRWPAAVMTRAVDRLGQPTGATMVVQGPADVELLPPGSAPVPVADARSALEARLSRLLVAAVWIQYRRDYNRTRWVPRGGELMGRGFAEPDRVGYGLAVRAAW